MKAVHNTDMARDVGIGSDVYGCTYRPLMYGPRAGRRPVYKPPSAFSNHLSFGWKGSILVAYLDEMSLSKCYVSDTWVCGLMYSQRYGNTEFPFWLAVTE